MLERNKVKNPAIENRALNSPRLPARSAYSSEGGVVLAV